jgi:hypothetical protein
MSAQAIITRPLGSQRRAGSLAIAVIATTTLAAGLGLVIASGLMPAAPATELQAPAFDAVKFRAEEKSLQAPAFDAVKFRAEEKILSQAPAFDAVRFRAEEKSLSVQAPAFDAVRFRAEEKGLK